MEPNIVVDNCFLLPILKHIGSIIFSDTVFAAILVPLIGLFVFRRQREYELVRKRYLDEGLDIISDHVEYAQGVFRHNWARSLSLIKNFRDAGKDTAKELYSTDFIQLDPSRFELSRNYILKELVGDNIYSKVQELMFAYVTEANSFFMYDLCQMVRMYVEGTSQLKIKSTRAAIVEEFTKHTIEKEKEFRRFYSLLGELRTLSTILVREKFTFKDINEFKKKREVQLSIKRLRDKFEAELNNKNNPNKAINSDSKTSAE